MKIRLYKVFIFILFLLACGLVYLKQDWFLKQYDKLCGIYYVYKGDKAYSRLHLQKAIENYDKGLKLYPEHYSAWFNLGNLYVVYEDYFSATEAYLQAIRYNPKMMIARMNYGIVASEKLGDFDGAIEQYEEIIKTKRHLFSIPFVYSNRKSYKLNKGIAYYNMGFTYRKKALYVGEDSALQREYLQEALESYKNAVKILKKDYDARYNLGLTYHMIGDYNNAGMTYCDAIQLAPMNYEAHYNLAVLLRHMGYYKEAIDEMKKANTLITGVEGHSLKQQYIFGIMNDTSMNLLTDEEKQYMMLQEAEEEKMREANVAYVHGKLVISDDLDRTILKNFKACGSKQIFVDNSDYDD